MSTQTVKGQKDKKKDGDRRDIFAEQQRILPLQILDVYLSELIAGNPKTFCFANQNFILTQIAGTVVKIKSSLEHKVVIEVSDGSAIISCILEDMESVFEVKPHLDNLLETCSEHATMDKKELFKFSDMNIGEFMKSIEGKEEKWLITCCKIFADKLNKEMKDYPLNENINVGDNVVLVGKVVQFKDNDKTLYVKALKRISDQSEFIEEMIKIIHYKESYLNNL